MQDPVVAKYHSSIGRCGNGLTYSDRPTETTKKETTAMTRQFHLASCILAAAITLSGCESTGSSGSGYDRPDDNWFTRLVGAASDGAESQLRINGFRQVDSFDSGRDGEGSVWFSDASGQCLQVITVKGRVDSANDIQSHPRCRR